MATRTGRNLDASGQDGIPHIANRLIIVSTKTTPVKAVKISERG